MKHPVLLTTYLTLLAIPALAEEPLTVAGALEARYRQLSYEAAQGETEDESMSIEDFWRKEAAEPVDNLRAKVQSPRLLHQLNDAI